MKLESNRSFRSPVDTRHTRRALRPQPGSARSPEGTERRRRGDAVDGFDRSPMKALRRELMKLFKLLQKLSEQSTSSGSSPLPDPRLPDTFTPGPAGSSGGLGSTGGSTGSTGGAPAGGGCSAANPYANGWPPARYGPGYAYAKADASLTWDQLAKLFAEGKVGVNTGGSCGMTNAERLSALRSYWDNSVKSGKSPAECGFSLLCSPGNPPPGIHLG